MSFILAPRLTYGASLVRVPICLFSIEADTCSIFPISGVLTRSGAKVLRFTDANGANYTAATEITLDFYPRRFRGKTALLSYTFTGGDISLVNDSTYQVKLTNADAEALPSGMLHAETWITLTNGDRVLVGAGLINVSDTRRYDA